MKSISLAALLSLLFSPARAQGDAAPDLGRHDLVSRSSAPVSGRRRPEFQRTHGRSTRAAGRAKSLKGLSTGALRRARSTVGAAKDYKSLSRAYDNSGRSGKASRLSGGVPSSRSPRTKKMPAGLSPVDSSIDPCADFYQYACGPWMSRHPIPSDQPRWSRFNELDLKNEKDLSKILRQAAKNNPGRAPEIQKIGDLYSSCMDQRKVDVEGLAPLKGALGRIAAIQDPAALASEISHLHQAGVDALFGFGSAPDDKNSKMAIATADQGGLGLPSRDYYFPADAAAQKLLARYKAHMARMFKLLGDDAKTAALEAGNALAFETALASAALGPEARRDPAAVYHKKSLQALEKSSPLFNWKDYLSQAGAPSFQSLNVAVPGFFAQVNALARSAPLQEWKSYLRWCVVRSYAGLLPEPFVAESFNFFGKTLRGQKELSPRWKRCVRLVDGALGDALGKAYVEAYFKPEQKAAALAMVKAIEKSLGEDIDSLSWMSPKTKKLAQAKLAGMTNKIGYPSKWKDYSSVAISRGDLLGDMQRASAYESRRDLAKIGRPVDEKEWDMTPPTVNAYYDPQRNDINFPAGILQPPFYGGQAGLAVNLGAIGAVMGHEMSHGFDDQGRQYDASGNRRDWWTPGDAKAFEKRAQCIENEYSGFKVKGALHENGKLTLGENIADNGGVRLAYNTLQNTLRGNRLARAQMDPGGLSPERLFFLSYAQVWCSNMTPQNAKYQVLNDPHSLPRFRVNGVLSNMPEFGKAFSCGAGAPMQSKDPCRVW